MPSVPEVSLIFDKPLGSKRIEHTGFHSPPVQSKGLARKSNLSSPLNVDGSYAAWKEQNYSCKPQSSKVNDCGIPREAQSNRHYEAHSYHVDDSVTGNLNESKEKRYVRRKDVHNGLQHEEEIRRRNDDYTSRYNYEISAVDASPMERKQSIRAHSNKPGRSNKSMSPTPHSPNPRIGTNNCIANENEHYPLSYRRKSATPNSKQQRIPFNDSIAEQNVPVSSLPINPNSLQRNELQLPHYLGQQYPYFNMNAYPFPQIHPYSIQNTENPETVKNLLQIINSQNEQIKSLQTQVDRLLKMQEENLKDRKRCLCSLKSERQSEQLCANPNDVPNASNYVTNSEDTNRPLYRNEQLRDKRREYSKENENENVNQSESVLTDTQSKQKFVEKKVSIGVMTSFEFTVQNSPFTIDMDDYEKTDNQQKQENATMCNAGGGHRDTNESLRRYKNSFTRMPSAQLENIVEDSESYMSSSQQQSSNLNASTSTKDLERQTYIEVRKETDAHRSESPKLCNGLNTKLNETENCIPKHLERTFAEDSRNCETMRRPMMQRNAANTEYGPIENKNYEVNAPATMNHYKKQSAQADINSAKRSNSANSSDYYRDYQKIGQINGTRRTNCIEDSLILNGGDLKINERPPPTPEPSIHVDMQEYSSDDDSEKVKRSSKVGWTFYNNVLGQVNHLLQNSCVGDDQQQNQAKVNTNDRDETENKAVMDTVKVATLEQLKKLGISLSENPEAKESNNSNK